MAQSRLTFKGRPYLLDLDQALTVQRLVRIKEWFGPELGRYGSFYRALAELDPQAVLCVVWLARLEAKEVSPEPLDMLEDFPLSDFALERIQEPGEERKDEDPTDGAAAPLTPSSDGSTETPDSSEVSISASSPATAISHDET